MPGWCWGRVTQGTRKLWGDKHVHHPDLRDGHPLVMVCTEVRIYQSMHSKYVYSDI